MEDALIGMFEMLIERLSNLEAAVASQGLMLQNAADVQTYRLECSAKDTRIMPAFIGSSLRGFVIRKMYDGQLRDDDLLALNLSLGDFDTTTENSVVAAGSEHVVFHTKSLRDALDVVHRARVAHIPVPEGDTLVNAYCVPPIIAPLAIAYVKHADLRAAWAALTPLQQILLRAWRAAGPSTEYNFLNRDTIVGLV
jgi:hypothetical protein